MRTIDFGCNLFLHLLPAVSNTCHLSLFCASPLMVSTRRANDLRTSGRLSKDFRYTKQQEDWLHQALRLFANITWVYIRRLRPF